MFVIYASYKTGQNQSTTMFVVCVCAEIEEAGRIGHEADGREAILAEKNERKTAKEQIEGLEDVKKEGGTMDLEEVNRENKGRENVRLETLSFTTQVECDPGLISSLA